jgi:hypothetical protein
VKCQNEVTKQLAGMQGKPGGVGGRVRGRGSDWIGEDGVAPPRHLCFFSSRPVLAQGRGPATQWHVAHSTRACRPAHALPCWLAPSQLFCSRSCIMARARSRAPPPTPAPRTTILTALLNTSIFCEHERALAHLTTSPPHLTCTATSILLLRRFRARH